MADHDFTVKDSSIYDDSSATKLLNRRDAAVKIGIVKETRKVSSTNENRFIVEVWDKSQHIPVLCTYITRFGGVYNYEEYNWRGFYAGNDAAGRSDYDVRPGDIVLVAYVNGTSQEGVIIGGIKHPGRTPEFEPSDGVVYASEFNGVKQEINVDGEYTTTFRGLQTNIGALNTAPSGAPIPPPTYNTTVGTTYTKFDKTGGWITNDNATSLPQSIHIDKAGGQIIVTSGNIVLTMDKAGELTTLLTKELVVNATDKMDTNTKDWATIATSTAKIKSPKIAFGTDGIELLDQVIKALENLGKVKPISPVGPCAPLMATPEWPAVQEVISKITSIKGSL